MNHTKDFSTSLAEKIRSGKRTFQKGLSLIEAAMVLALSAIVVAGVIAYYQSASDNQKTEATIAMLTNLISVVHSTYASQPNYKGISSDLIAKTGLLPASMVKDGDKETKSIHAPGGGKVTISMGKVNFPKMENYFNISFTVAKKLCSIMTRLDLGSSVSNVYIGNNLSDNNIGNKPLNVADSQSKCDRLVGKNEKVQMIYEFH